MELFNSPDHAAMFALRYSSQQYAQSQIAKHMQRAGAVRLGQGRGLVGLDGSAQAGMIRARLERMKPLHMACIIARFAERTDECPCCNGHRMTEEYKKALMDLAEWAKPLIRDEVDSHRMRFGIVQSFFDRKASITQLAKNIGMPARTVLDQKNKIWPSLTKMSKEAQAEMGDMLADLCEDMPE